MLNPNWSVPIGQPLTVMDLNHNHGHRDKFFSYLILILIFKLHDYLHVGCTRHNEECHLGV